MPLDTGIEELVDWAKSHGTSINPNVTIYHDPVTGLSFGAVNDVQPRSELVNCSYKTTLSYLNVIECHPSLERYNSISFPIEFIDVLKLDDANIIGHFFLIQQYLLKENSFWWNYIKLLPQPDQPESIGVPIWWPEEDQKFLNGTNAEPPIKKRRELWKSDWEKGVELLKGRFSDWEQYTYPLYQWAATIFGSRSFRPSLTIPEEVILKSGLSEEELKLNLGHIQKDRFSVLLPVTDIGNHSAVNQVEWSRDADTATFKFVNRELIPQGTQIYNHYGDKSNSELLVAYGFILPNTDRDLVNLKLTPTPEARRLRRLQKCHVRAPLNQPEQEFMYNISSLVDGVSRSGLRELKVFSHGLVDTMSVMLANGRESTYLADHPEYCIEGDPAVFQGAMYRNMLFVLRLLRDKLSYEISRIQQSGSGLGQPQNRNQELATEYRKRQLSVLEAALPPISNRFNSALSFSSFCAHPEHTARKNGSINNQINDCLELLSLECAFEWMRLHFPSEHEHLERLISEDQEEDVPLDWAVLVEDWDNTYWILFIYFIWCKILSNEYELRTSPIGQWMVEMDKAYKQELARSSGASEFYADLSEHETIDKMIRDVNKLLRREENAAEEVEKLRNFASWVAHEEVIPAPYVMQSGSQAGEPVEQKMLCISKMPNICGDGS